MRFEPPSFDLPRVRLEILQRCAKKQNILMFSQDRPLWNKTRRWAFLGAASGAAFLEATFLGVALGGVPHLNARLAAARATVGHLVAGAQGRAH